MYIADEQQLGIRAYFQQKNPAAYQAMTATMLESARKGYWKPTEAQLRQTAQLHADMTRESGAACTDFVCNNASLQKFIEGQLTADARQGYSRQMSLVKNGQTDGKATVLEKQGENQRRITGTVLRDTISAGNWIIRIVPVILLLAVIIIYLRKRNGDHS